MTDAEDVRRLLDGCRSELHRPMTVFQHAAPVRAAAWARLDSLLPRHLLELVTSEVPLADVPLVAEQILAGSVRGRVVVDVDGAGA